MKIRDESSFLFHEPSRYWIKAMGGWINRYVRDQVKSEQIRILWALINSAPNKQEVLDNLVLAGFERWVRAQKERVFLPDAAAAHRARGMRAAATERGWDRRKAALTADKAKAAAFERIVEMLDCMRIGSKVLGDCTKADLLREAAHIEADAKDMVIHATFLRTLAGIVGPKGTVREAADRGKIVALLTTTFKESA